ncbi:MAG: polysaccharide deacetylase family protein [Verrucomicrobia bacterium]|nr:polysaccharide deacetylase family protein [Verrucomicrobiota bacterium]MCH8526708.1 polysaccharide deacetylase family protein [Kiritimatiellia bacterium]
MLRNPVPLLERENLFQKPLELLTGRYPAFLFGARVGNILPVFTFRNVTLPYLEPFLVYLLENNYQTLGSSETADYISGKKTLKMPSVVLHFDNTWASLWTVVGPLLRRYDMRAVAFAVPGRIREAADPRPAWGQPGHDPDVDRSKNPFCTWPELKALSAEGRIDIESNTWSHAKIFCCDLFERLILPETVLPYLSWPVVSDAHESLKTLSSSNVFHPLLPTRSRLSDALKHDVDASMVRRIHDDPNAAPYLFRQHFLQIETLEERENAIRFELHASKDELEARLKKPVRHLALPWGVCGSVTQSLLPDSGYQSVFADRVGGYRAAVPGQNPYRIMRLDHTYIHCLPGRLRKCYWRIGR